VGGTSQPWPKERIGSCSVLSECLHSAGVRVIFVWKYADGRIERDPAPTGDYFGVPLEVHRDDPQVVRMNGRDWVVGEVNLGPDAETSEVVMNEHV
jgi:hypothetical protein